MELKIKPALFLCLFLVFIVGFFFQSLCIKISEYFELFDTPTQRRWHTHPTPFLGGLGIMGAFIFSLSLFSSLGFYSLESIPFSLYQITFCALTFLILGLRDDLYGLGPKSKLLIESITAIIAITSIPVLREICQNWSHFFGFWVWPLAVIWIVGISNATNLIDGMDGLASSHSLMILASVSILSIGHSEPSLLAKAIVLGLSPSILAFFVKNKPPAQIFMGNHGSLCIGFLLAMISSLSLKSSPSGVSIISLFFLFGYPILDMGLATRHRIRLKKSLFKADFYHLHYRLCHLGIPPKKTITLLLNLNLSLQIAGLSYTLTPLPIAILLSCTALLRVLSLVTLIESLETGTGKEPKTLSIPPQQNLNEAKTIPLKQVA